MPKPTAYAKHPLDGVSILKEPAAPYKIRTPSEVFPFCNDILSLQQEAFFVITLNTRNRVLSRCLISYGILDASLVHPREVFRYAVTCAAKCILLLHNHPSGDTTPSAEDIWITRQLVEAGKILDILVLDHVIIGQDCFRGSAFSLRETGTVLFAI